MATFKSRAFIGGVPFRAIEDQPFDVTASILVPSGTALASGDVLKFFKLGANIRILEATLAVDDLDTGASITLDLGYDLPTGTDDDDAFLANSTLGQAGGTARVENGGTIAFAVGLLAPQTEVMTVQAKVETSPAGNPATDRYLVCSMRCVQRPGAPSTVPEYVYADRYNSSGVGSI
jgi:hypothetical protein